MITIDEEFKKAQAIITVSESLVEKGRIVDLSALEKVVTHIHDIIVLDGAEASGCLDRIREISAAMDRLSQKIIGGAA